MGIGVDDIFLDTTGELDRTGLNPLNPSDFTNGKTLENALLIGSEIDANLSLTPGTVIQKPAPATAWARFVAWLDSIFHFNATRDK